ncbi:MAG: hypothetical protein H6505_03525 [Calditrichaeota bacterium]|nr:hypothetical protein [Calditrichota bacterium]
MRGIHLLLLVCLFSGRTMAMTVPGLATGTTCPGGNNCSLWPGSDHVEMLTVATSGYYKFRLNGSSFAAQLAIGSTPCASDVALQDGVCLGQNSVTCVFLAAGTYYGTIDCAVPACCGTWQLTAESCTPAPGETASSPIVISVLPYSTDNSTDCHSNDLDHAGCTNGSDGPDLFYRYTPTSSTSLNIALTQQNAFVAYRRLIVDGVCYSGTGATVSVPNYAVTAGVPVNIVVDACCGQAIDFNLQVWDLSPFCLVGCDFYAQEPEVCSDEYVDTYNCGCDGPTPVFTVWNGWDGICGKSGTYVLNGEARRESDWYEFVYSGSVNTSFSFRAEFPVHARWWRRGANGCVDRVLVQEALAAPCTNTFIANSSLPSGTYWMEIVPQVTSGIPCTSRYIFTVYVQPLPVVAPSRLVIQPNLSDIVLYWNSTGAAVYNVYRSPTLPVDPTPANFIGTATDTMFTDSGIVGSEQQLYYVVTAENP